MSVEKKILEKYTRTQSMLESKSRSWRLRFFHWLTKGRDDRDLKCHTR